MTGHQEIENCSCEMCEYARAEKGQLKPGQTIPCQFCGMATRMLATRSCDNCWEVKKRLSNMTATAIARVIKSALPDRLTHIILALRSQS